MTEAETARVVAMVQALWSREPLALETPDVWHPFLASLDLDEVEAAVRELHVNPDPYAGRGAPDVGMIVRKVAERADDSPDWDQARREILRAIQYYRPPRDVATTNPHAGPPADYWSHPLIAAFAEHAWDEWRMSPNPASDVTADAAGTFFAQQRDAYKALRARAARGKTLAVVGAQRKRDLERFNPLAAIGAGDAA
jgi:hypothetical protein